VAAPLPSTPIPRDEPAPHGRSPRAPAPELADLQDSFLPAEYGDPELRAGLSEVRRQLGDVPARGRQLIRTLDR
jgi:hypothetical protein